MNVYKKFSFVPLLTGERTWHESYLIKEGLETMADVSSFILDDVSQHGSDFEVDAGEEGKITFSKGDMWKTKIQYTWN